MYTLCPAGPGGQLKKIYAENGWLNHIQFPPTEPDILMICHEGPWHKVDRIWTLNVNGGKPVLMHKRTVDGEIAGHEFKKDLVRPPNAPQRNVFPERKRFGNQREKKIQNDP